MLLHKSRPIGTITKQHYQTAVFLHILYHLLSFGEVNSYTMNNNQHAFITEYLHHRSPYTAYCLAYNVQDQSDYENIMSSANQLMDDPDVGGRIRSILSNMHSEVEQQIRKEQQTTLLTVQRKRELLAQIATGEMYAVQTYKGKDCNQCTQHVKPTINQMLKAIDLDSKLAGHYSVHNQQLKAGKAVEEKISPEKTAEPQQNTTNTPSTSRSLEPTKLMSRAGGGVRSTAVEHAQIGVTTHPQAATSQNNLSLPFRGIGGKTQQNTTFHVP